MILFLKTLFFTLLMSGFVAGWVPLHWFEQQPRWPEIWRWHHYAAALLFALSAIVYLHCVWLFAVKGRGTPAPIDPPKRLVQRGIYGWVRNPMDLSLLTLVGSEALFFWSIHISLYFLCLVCAVHLLVVLYEESALSYQFGALYEDYKRAAPRWLPRKPRPALETIAPFASRH